MCVIETSPIVETRRLILRAPGMQDCSRIAALANDRDIARMTKRMPHPFQVQDAEDFVLHVAAVGKGRGKGIGKQLWLVEHMQVQIHANLPQMVLRTRSAHAAARAHNAGRFARKGRKVGLAR